MPSEPEDQELQVSPVNRRRFAKRVREVVAKFNSKEEFAQAAYLSVSALNNYLSGENKMEPSRARLLAMAKAGGVPVGWLAAGEGAPDETVPAPDAMAAAGYWMVPRYDVVASAGPGLLTDQEHIVDYMAFRTEWIRRAIGTDPRNLCLITATGDSMEPTIRPGDLLLVDRSIDRILDDAIYVIVRSDVLVVKRIQRKFGGPVLIVSDNPNYRDDPMEEGDLQDLRVAGRVVWIARMI